VSSVTAPAPVLDAPVPEGGGSRRRTELIMLVFVFALVAFAFANVGFSLKDALPPGLAEYMGAFIVIIVAAHLVMRRFAPYADPLLLPLAAV
jgi:hypothetical protein